ncbi:helix-turn-helix domain-containing protein [Rhizobium sp. BK251]|uniref:helix-turn-helix domain-containing protein n=1 Tax=Rhizobium sp. BK251 TaxID=2512125 RepID=UPI001044F04D|nr:helix-turn-helix domain-containing protein [Rhizobium sp. BK251]TCL64085.1 AraC family transcriptional regulator [Rhizobium sp. BK251]
MAEDHFNRSGEWTGSPRSFLIERHTADAMSAAHWHDHVEINLLFDGAMTYLFNGRQERVEAGRLVLFWAAIPHQTILVTPDAPLICIYLPLCDFLALSIDKKARQAIMQGTFVVEPRRQETTLLSASTWAEEWGRGDPLRRQLIADEAKLRVRRLILDHTEDQGSSIAAAATPISPAIRHSEVLTDLINRHFSEQLSLTELGKRANVHPTTANRAFRDVLGISVMEYLTRYRLARAMQRLVETEDSILEIALDCGFGSSSRFYDVFKQRTGTTPRQFRSSLEVPHLADQALTRRTFHT